MINKECLPPCKMGRKISRSPNRYGISSWESTLFAKDYIYFIILGVYWASKINKQLSRCGFFVRWKMHTLHELKGADWERYNFSRFCKFCEGPSIERTEFFYKSSTFLYLVCPSLPTSLTPVSSLSLEARGLKFLHSDLSVRLAQPRRKTLISQLLDKNLKIWLAIFLILNWEVYKQNFCPLASKLKEEFEMTYTQTHRQMDNNFSLLIDPLMQTIGEFLTRTPSFHSLAEQK